MQKSEAVSKRSAEQWMKQESLENVAWRSLADTYKTVYFHINSDLRKYGLTPPQYAVLRTLGKSPTGVLSMSEIGKEMIVTFANITTIVDNLEKRNYARRVRDVKDRRVVKVELTPLGSRLFRRIFWSHKKQVAKLMESLSDSELKTLINYTSKIRNSISVRQ